ncbi:MAG: prepilin-type N-terminal cleavage/methylation domain-containing protein [Planctomycetota bacterium]|nr:prepilin-type N-terminal cleavage/methylation domain-containing protein [Planctomycetota bacterium]
MRIRASTPHLRTSPGTATRRAAPGFTLIELLVVMGIILLMITLVLLSVNSMLRSSRISRTLSLLVGAMDEARTAAITIRRSTKVDLTRLDAEGKMNRLTVVGPFFNETFESYNDAKASSGPTPETNGWVTSGDWVAATSVSPPPSITSDGSRCLRMQAGQKYWNVGSRVDTVQQEDFEFNLLARVKFLPTTTRADRSISAFVAIKDNGAKDIADGYSLTLKITPTQPPTFPGRNQKSEVILDKMSGPGTLGTLDVGAAVKTKGSIEVDANGTPAPTTCLVENVWYRVSLSVKIITNPALKDTAPEKYKAIVAGKVWADGQLEPWNWTVGPLEDKPTPLGNGPGGFAVTGPSGADALLDDVLFDVRPIRVLPPGLMIDAMRANPATPDSVLESEWEVGCGITGPATRVT